MNRTPVLTSILWISLGSAVIGCGEDDEGKDGTSGPSVILPAQVELAVFCGVTAPEPVRFVVSNSGDKPLSITSATTTGGFKVIADLPNTVQPGATLAFSIEPPAAVVGTDMVGQVKTGKLTVNTDDPQGPSEVVLRAKVGGAKLEFQTMAGAAVPKIDLISADSSCPAPATVFLKNTGTQPVTIGEFGGDYPVEAVVSSAEATTPGITATIAAGASVEYRISANDTEGCVPAGQVTYQVTGGACVSQVVLPVTQQVGGASDACFCSSGGSGT
ncbi:MAG: hypothetical protein IPI49_01395 [Myxococcales bacterium]|nr:hypothetical protein [Myxococcales bacterium]